MFPRPAGAAIRSTISRSIHPAIHPSVGRLMADDRRHFHSFSLCLRGTRRMSNEQQHSACARHWWSSVLVQLLVNKRGRIAEKSYGFVSNTKNLSQSCHTSHSVPFFPLQLPYMVFFLPERDINSTKDCTNGREVVYNATTPLCSPLLKNLSMIIENFASFLCYSFLTSINMTFFFPKCAPLHF